ncbi:MAG: sirohydrochlorin cobaltochelatase [Lachnospiraceae bacterium]|nr:sirohydrochlorin cobaltochelatase [Lachnospiraceae bacterium]
MKKKVALLLTFVLVLSLCCGFSGIRVLAEDAEASGEPDQAKADECAALIDAIYVQERTDETDEQCAAAKAAWDALTDEEKELVEGEEADPDYFGRDTGDASLDDPRNADEIGENELLVVSFGTSFNDSRAQDIGGIEAALEEAYPDWAVRRAFTAQIIINHVQARDGEFIDNVDQALARAVENSVKNLVIQPTHLMHGAEYDELCGIVDEYADQFETITIAEPLLGEVGEDATVINKDKERVAVAVTEEAVKEAGYETLADAEADGVAFVFMGHGTAHVAKVTYSQMQTQMGELGYKNVFIGTVEGEPEETACENIIEAVNEAGYTKVILRPLMVVAGDHANNDMAGDDEDSWKSMFEASGYFESIDCQISGLGRIPAVQKLYVEHAGAAILRAELTGLESQEKADITASLIDQIYVQERTEDTDLLCVLAKTAWDFLTEEEQEMVEGEEGDADYFGRDTGDAAADDPRNGNAIGENELLVVSFGTSFNDSRAEDIGGIEAALEEAYPDWAVRRAFTAQIIINHVQARDGEYIDNVDQALARAVANGVKNLVIQPTHLMHGAEYDELCGIVDEYAEQFETIVIAEPLLGEVGEDATVINPDKERVAVAVTEEAVKEAGYETLDDAEADGVAFVFMGHGTAHVAKVTYSQMQTQMNELGYKNVFIGTVEGEPEETACENIIEAVTEAGYTKIVLRPLMVVAGDHANNDMAGDDEDSWKSMFEASGNFSWVECQISGLGRIPAVQELYVEHAGAAIAEIGTADAALADGTYLADFSTDGSMFHVNEVCDGKGTLTVKDGEMVIHVTLVSKNIVNLFPGLAEDAQKEGAELLEPTVDEVTYHDGLTEEVYGFDIPVPALDEEFDVALVGTKGKWYDHKVIVTNPVPAE